MDWRGELDEWLAPFVAALRHKTRGRMCPAYIAGLIGPGDRKSIQPMAARDGDISYDRLHHFIASGVWDEEPLEAALLAEADRQVGSEKAWLIIDDTALPKKGRHSVGVGPQYASALDKHANCQTLVSVTLVSGEVPIMVGLRLFLPGEEVWLVGEHRSTGERKYYLSNLPVDTPIKQLAGAIKARRICEQGHQQLKEELGLDHFEGRSSRGLHRHALMSMIALAFLQTHRLK